METYSSFSASASDSALSMIFFSRGVMKVCPLIRSLGAHGRGPFAAGRLLRHRRAEFLQKRQDHAFLLAQKREQQVLDIEGLVVAFFGQRLGLLQGFLGFSS